MKKLGYYIDLNTHKSVYMYELDGQYYYKSKSEKIFVDINEYSFDQRRVLNSMSKEELIDIVMDMDYQISELNGKIGHIENTMVSLNSSLMCKLKSSNGISY